MILHHRPYQNQFLYGQAERFIAVKENYRLASLSDSLEPKRLTASST